MSNTVIKVEDLSKQYRLGQVSTGTITHDLNRFWHKVRGKEDPYLMVGDVNNRAEKGESEYVWALKDINFEVQQGDTLGIIGKNGAGKSTLLKLLSRVTAPTTGNIKVRGRIASLLEVGTGFHPELTGRENIFLNGAILGMTKKEITSKFDEIVEFSGIARYVDTPVKRYSSGMYVRLAFAVAAHLEPEILIVDEVLAVGDAEFQKKCLGKMKDVAEHGRTVLFVSHNMGAIRSLCNKGLLLKNGGVQYNGSIDTIVNQYLKAERSSSKIEFDKSDGEVNKPTISLSSIEILDNNTNGVFLINEQVKFRISGVNHSVNKALHINLFFNSDEGVNIFTTCSTPEVLPFAAFEAICTIPGNFLNDISYYIDLMVVAGGTEVLVNVKDILMIEGKEQPREAGWMGKFPGYIKPLMEWNVNVK